MYLLDIYYCIKKKKNTSIIINQTIKFSLRM